jgi:hypothetical protein
MHPGVVAFAKSMLGGCGFVFVYFAIGVFAGDEIAFFKDSAATINFDLVITGP